ncbi:hypothetical protein OG235_36940 [Streptomyces sp. NBC_00024]|uniref:hypothetical protein n=1 Tax=Streptomyces sp. NBC_00024 TaxID=2903612 RepID=UPI00324B0D83
MRHTPGTARPAAARGLGAVVLLVLLALLHATFSPGLSHLSALDLDGCRTHTVAMGTLDCEEPTAVVTASGAEGHQDGDAAQSCDAPAYGPRTLAGPAHLPAVSGTMPGVTFAASPANVSPAARGASLSDAPSGSLILRC